MEYQKIAEAASYLQQQTGFRPDTGLIIGTGLSGMIDQMEVLFEIDYAKIPHFVSSTVDSHRGSLLFGKLHEHLLVVMNGRFHFYEGYTMDEVTFPVRVMKLLGINQLLISNACGALNPSYRQSELMVIDDHINFLPTNPLVGKNIGELGPRFPDMSRPYDRAINLLLRTIAEEKNIPMHEGVYAAWIGPSLETRAEYRFLRSAGADVVGMSTVPEVIVARHMGLKVAAVSVVTDLCDPDHLEEATIHHILKHASEGGKKLGLIFSEFLRRS